MNPKVAPEVTIEPPNGVFCIACDSRSGRYFRLGVQEAGFLGALDGSQSLAALQERNSWAFSPAQVDRLIAWFRQNGLLEGAPPVSAEPSTSRLARWFQVLSTPERWRITLMHPNHLLDQHRPWVDGFFSRKAFAIYLGIYVLPLVLLAVRPKSFPVQSPDLSGAATLLWLYALMLGTNVLHEFAHAVACKHYGGKVGRIGLMIFYLQPLMFCDVSDSWRFRDKHQRITVAMAGIFLQSLLSALAITVWWLTGSPIPLYYAWINLLLALFNLFPFVKLDGYWVLVHYWEEPQLQTRGIEAVNRLVRESLGLRRDAGYPRIPASLLAFGIGHCLSLPLFWALGLWGLVRLSALLPPGAAWPLLAGISAWMAIRLGKAVWAWVSSFGQDSAHEEVVR